jgi:uncharacterized membrane protein YgdD (TMEM256/DUF423 family)
VKWIFGLSGIFGALFVALGALLGHGLFDDRGAQALDWLATAQRYGMWHTVALLAVCVAGRGGGSSRLLVASSCAFAIGIVLFSGSLAILALAGVSWLSAVAPIGGGSLILGWLLVAAAGFGEIRS